MKRNVEIVSLVYKSVAYLEFIAEQLKRECCKVPGWDVGVRVVLNDADPKVLERSKSMDVPITVYNDPVPSAPQQIDQRAHSDTGWVRYLCATHRRAVASMPLAFPTPLR